MKIDPKLYEGFSIYVCTGCGKESSSPFSLEGVAHYVKGEICGHSKFVRPMVQNGVLSLPKVGP